MKPCERKDPARPAPRGPFALRDRSKGITASPPTAPGPAPKVIWFEPASQASHQCLLSHDCPTTTLLHRCTCGAELSIVLRRTGAEPRTH